MPFACGLDFGTSNSTMGMVSTGGAPRLLPLEADNPTIPSVLFFSFEDDLVHFGRAGVAEYVAGVEGRLLRSLKSVLGTALIGETTRIKVRSLGFLEILGIFIAEIKRRGEVQLGGPIDSVVVGRPVHFVDDDSQADRNAENQLREAVRAQGFAHIDFQYEPIAAALDYERQAEREQLALIVDLGGGTSDFSVVRVGPDLAGKPDRSDDILATAGVHVGGTDFDRLLSMAEVMPELGLGTTTRDGKRHLPTAPYYDLSTWHRINRLYTAKTLRDLRSTRREAQQAERVDQMIAVVEGRQGHRLIGAVEAVKIALSDVDAIEFDYRQGAVEIATPITIAQLSEAIAGSVGRIADTIGATLTLAGINAAQIDSVIMTGGSTQLPVIGRTLASYFPGANMVRTDVLGSVGLGLALDARRKFGRGVA
ncbi:Hsp70 family protein [Devosia rhodophyticola]|uniref:Hsp70 family protein n=1 Tax=Devosia rhodophyticola TaxID=3026423 RepID=A0ABY7YYD6_9HYPH|nr:Hsp70 family protein [Devosia rhodophyticola]WDR06410.1 Hsp70 family protein [Devosia rhodophyticola]